MENLMQNPEEFSAPESKLIRRELLPWWVKIFCWLFMLLGVGSVACLIYGLFGNQASISLYGFETHEPNSLLGIMITVIMVFKGFAAYALWFEKDNAINIAKIDALSGIVLCVISMFAVPFFTHSSTFNFRLEILMLMGFYVWLNKIEYRWDNLEEQ